MFASVDLLWHIILHRLSSTCYLCSCHGNMVAVAATAQLWCKYIVVLTVVFIIIIIFFFQDLTVHINVSVEQHTHSLKQLLHNISTNQEAEQELSRWGLEISSNILVVRTHTHALTFSHANADRHTRTLSHTHTNGHSRAHSHRHTTHTHSRIYTHIGFKYGRDLVHIYVRK